MNYNNMSTQELEALEETGELVWRDDIDAEKKRMRLEHPDLSDEWLNKHYIAKHYGQGAWIISKSFNQL